MPALAVTRTVSSPAMNGCSRSVASSSAATASASPPLVPAQQAGELVAAEPGDRVAAAQAPGERARDGADQLVAGLVAERVVDVLEAVDVEHEHGAGAHPAARGGDLELELLDEAAAVEQVGERVVVGEVLEAVLGGLALGDVGQQPLDQQPALLVEHARGLVAHPHDAAVARVHPVLDADPLAGRQPVLGGEHRLAVVLVQAADPQRRVGAPLLRRVAEQGLDEARDVQPQALGARLGLVDDRGEPLDERGEAALGAREPAACASRSRSVSRPPARSRRRRRRRSAGRPSTSSGV